MAHRPLIVGNWKMFKTIPEALRMVGEFIHLSTTSEHAEVVFAPPYTALYSLSVVLSETNYKLCAQNCFYEDEGAYTGEISPVFLKDLDCQYVLLGHSERRQYFSETDAIILKKLQAALRADLIPIVCIGESLKERESGQAEAIIERQLQNTLFTLEKFNPENIVLAYEPLWAIGTGINATADQVAQMHSFIKDLISKKYDMPTAQTLRLLYGGSVKPNNAKELLSQNHVDGLLVGGASLQAKDFYAIVATALEH